MYLAGKDKDFAKSLGVDAGCIEKVATYFGGTMMEARRLLEPVDVPSSSDSEEEDRSEDID